jgi:hypothetical protein
VDGGFRGGVIAGALGLVVLLTLVGFRYELTIPDKPPRPRRTNESARAASNDIGRNPAVYGSYLAKDAETYGVGAVAPDALKKVFAYKIDDQEHELEPGKKNDSIEAAGLRLTVTLKDMAGGTKRMMMLRIENLTDKPLAYRVATWPDKGTQPCHQKEDSRHNALAVAARDVEMRSECIYRSGWKLVVKKVETMALPDLSYHYVSRLVPPQLGIDSRTARGHRPPRGEPCRLILPAEVGRGLEEGSIGWRDLIDFYARHRCDTYVFPAGYKAFTTDDERPLPAAGALK